MDTFISLQGIEKASQDLTRFTSKLDKSIVKLRSLGTDAQKLKRYGRMVGSAAGVFGAANLTGMLTGSNKPGKDAGIAESYGSSAGNVIGMIGGAAAGSFGGPLGQTAGAIAGSMLGSMVGGAAGRGVDGYLNPSEGSQFKTYGGDFYKGVDPKFYDQEMSRRPNYSLEDQIANQSVDFQDARNAQINKTMSLLHQELRQ